MGDGQSEAQQTMSVPSVVQPIADEPVDALTELGFTRLEAEIYAYLLKNSPATGYKIAQGIGKPVANTYKAIQSLELKGAILVENGSNRMCSAIPAAELLSALSNSFAERRTRAQNALRNLDGPREDERVYRLGTAEQAIERARQMLGAAREKVILTAGKSAIAQLRNEILKCAQRGVDVTAKLYVEQKLEGVNVVYCDPSGGQALERHGNELHLVVDSKQTLIAVFAAESGMLVNAYWSSSAMMALAHHMGLMHEIALMAVADGIADQAPHDQLLRRYRNHLTRLDPHGEVHLAG